jgi:uroporphyrinogen decarboxylase
MPEPMTSRQRLLTALDRGKPDRLPATTHHLMPYFLDKYMGGASALEFFDFFGLDAVHWVVAHKPDTERGAYFYAGLAKPESTESRLICSDDWRIETENLSGSERAAVRYKIHTPLKTLSMVLEQSSRTTWVAERLVKEKADIELLDKFAPAPLCDVEEVDRQAGAFGERGIVRGTVPGFDIYGQPGCWQDAAVLYGIEKLIMETFYDPAWVHDFLQILKRRKETFIRSTAGARFDLVELGGGDASSTVISPKIFDEFVAPYDGGLIDLAHQAGQRVVYHTCGGMMPFLDRNAGMNPDAMETFTPPAMGGDADLAEAKRRIGGRVCMIGGFDQFHHLLGCSPEETRRAVRRCFSEAGEGGAYILAPSDHFFDADLELLKAFADEARSCKY